MGYNKAAGDQLPASELNSFYASAGLYAASATGNDSYAITVTPTPNDYDDGDTYNFKADVGNTGTATLNVNSLGAKTIKKYGTADLVTGDIVAGQIVTVRYDGTNFQMQSNPKAVALTIVPQSTIGQHSNSANALSVNVNTTAHLGQIVIPFEITVNKISFRAGAVAVAGTVDLSLYSEDGQTRLFSVTSATVTANATNTVSVSAVVLPPGIYYIMINSNSTADVLTYAWNNGDVPFDVTVGIAGYVTSEPVLQGTLTITAGTPPTTITPTSITFATGKTLICRLDN